MAFFVYVQEDNSKRQTRDETIAPGLPKSPLRRSMSHEKAPHRSSFSATSTRPATLWKMAQSTLKRPIVPKLSHVGRLPGLLCRLPFWGCLLWAIA